MTSSEKLPQVWFITGASSGIGLELTQAALAAGESVIAVARTIDTLTKLPDHEQLLALSVDVRDQAALHDAVEQGVARFGRIDVVANNAGYGLAGAVEEISDAEARAIFDTNVFGVLAVLRATLPVLRRQRSGHILQSSSVVGQSAFPGIGLLAATKHAVEGLSDALAEEVRPLGIAVTLVQAGPTATAFGANLERGLTTISDYDQSVRSAPLRSAGSDVARVVTGIRAAVASDVPPRRLALGTNSRDAMRAALLARLADLDAWGVVTDAVDA